MDIWAEYDIGFYGPDGVRMISYENVRKEGIYQYNRASRRTKTVKIYVSNDPKYQTWKGGMPLWKGKMHYYGEVYARNDVYLFKDKSGKIRQIDNKGRFLKESHPFGL